MKRNEVEIFCDGTYPYTERIKNSAYEAAKRELQVELLKAQNWARETGQRIIALFEGRDAAGKGGTIRRIVQSGRSTFHCAGCQR